MSLEWDGDYYELDGSPELRAQLQKLKAELQQEREKRQAAEERAAVLEVALDGALKNAAHQAHCDPTSDCTCWVTPFRAALRDYTGALAKLKAEARAEFVKHICAAVTVHDGNTEWNECFYEVRFLGHTIWSCGGRRATVPQAAEKFATDLRDKIAKQAEREVGNG